MGPQPCLCWLVFLRALGFLFTFKVFGQISLKRKTISVKGFFFSESKGRGRVLLDQAETQPDQALTVLAAASETAVDTAEIAAAGAGDVTVDDELPPFPPPLAEPEQTD